MGVTKEYNLPMPIVDKRELKLLDDLTEKYNRLIQPSKINKLRKKIETILPTKIKEKGQELTDNITAIEIYEKTMSLIADGFKIVEEQAAKLTISENDIIEKINKVEEENDINKIDEICFARSYDIAKIVNSSKDRQKIIALIEGGSTGVAGFAGIPFNLVLSNLIYFRSVQLIAIYYGFDVKNNASELVIASQVFAKALSPKQDNINNELNGIIGKIMVMTQATAVKQTAKKTWTDMATRGGTTLLLAQMRALANKTAQKALENAGKKGLEKSVFKDVFEQIGRKLTLKTIEKSVPIVSALLGALIDTSQINKVIEYADIFYHKRFIMEKEERIYNLMNLDKDIIDIE